MLQNFTFSALDSNFYTVKILIKGNLNSFQGPTLMTVLDKNPLNLSFNGPL